MVVKKRLIWILLIFAAFVLCGLYFMTSYTKRQLLTDTQAPGKNWQSPKKVEDYFVGNLHMTPADLERMKNNSTVDFRLSENATLQAVLNNLYYYGFVRTEDSLEYALTHTKDNVPGRDNAIKLENGNTIDINASYRISEDMSAWEIADILLNQPTYFKGFDEYHYLFMP